MKNPRATHVYVIGFSDAVVKVGRTSNPENRFRQHAHDARIRRARIRQKWVLETPEAERAEIQLKLLGRFRLEPLTSEYFRGRYVPFMRAVIHRFQRVGLLPVESIGFREAAERACVTHRELLAAREWNEIRQDVHLPGEMGARFVTSEVDAWARRYWVDRLNRAIESAIYSYEYKQRRAQKMEARFAGVAA